MKRPNRKTNKTEIHVLVFPDHGSYVAQCLEYDITVQANDLEKLEERLVTTICSYIQLYLERKEMPFKDFPETPKSFWEMLSHSRSLGKPIRIPAPRKRTIDGKQIREYIPRVANLSLSPSPCV